MDEYEYEYILHWYEYEYEYISMSILSNDDVYTIQSYKRSHVPVLVKTLKFEHSQVPIYRL